MFTIHQPSSDIFESFDHLILMNKGRIMYQGPVEAVDEYFGDREHPLPPKYNVSIYRAVYVDLWIETNAHRFCGLPIGS